MFDSHLIRTVLAVHLILLGCALPAHSQGPVQHVIVVSADGLRGDLLQSLVANDTTGAFATFKRLETEGASTYNARADFDYTNTLPNHTSILSGRPVAQPLGKANTINHGYISNVSPGPTDTVHNSGNPNLAYVSSLFDVVHDHELSTGMYVSKWKFSLFEQSYNAVGGAPDLIGPDSGPSKLDSFVNMTTISGPLGTADDVAAAYLVDMAASHFSLSFVHYRNPDSAGHTTSWGSPTWNTAVQQVDGYLAGIMNLIETDPVLIGKTLLIVTADHGGSGYSHSDPTIPADYTIPFMVWGPGVDAGFDLYALNGGVRSDPGMGHVDYNAPGQPIRNSDSANLALSKLGLPAVPGSTVNVNQDLRLSLGAGALLSGDVASIDLAAGGAQVLSLVAPSFPGRLFVMLGSLSGTNPGFSYGGFAVPLNIDAYFASTLTGASGLMPGSFGTLDSMGRASVTALLPPASSPSLAGLTVNHAYAVLDPVTVGMLAVSNAADLSLVNLGSSGLVINEVDYDQTGTDTDEFIELFNAGGATVDLSNLVLDLVNGSGGVVYASIPLASAGSLNAGQYLVIGSASVVAGLPPGTASITFGAASNNVQNGAPDGIVLRDSGLGGLDGISYEGFVVGASEGLSGAGTDVPTGPMSLSRLPNGADSNDNAIDFGATASVTPGAPNQP